MKHIFWKNSSFEWLVPILIFIFTMPNLLVEGIFNAPPRWIWTKLIAIVFVLLLFKCQQWESRWYCGGLMAYLMLRRAAFVKMSPFWVERKLIINTVDGLVLMNWKIWSVISLVLRNSRMCYMYMWLIIKFFFFFVGFT